jgi:hypothetical protein
VTQIVKVLPIVYGVRNFNAMFINVDQKISQLISVLHTYIYICIYNIILISQTCLKRNLGITETCLYGKPFRVPRIQISRACIKMNLPAAEKKSVACVSVIGRFHCVINIRSKILLTDTFSGILRLTVINVGEGKTFSTQ